MAYLSIPAGMGALLLFGAVQLTDGTGLGSAGSGVEAETSASGRGSGLLLSSRWGSWPSRALVSWSNPIQSDAQGVMLAAGVGWGVYGARRGHLLAEATPLAENASNFCPQRADGREVFVSARGSTPWSLPG